MYNYFSLSFLSVFELGYNFILVLSGNLYREKIRNNRGKVRAERDVVAYPLSLPKDEEEETTAASKEEEETTHT